MLKDIDDRYKSISDISKTRSIISLGISCFRFNEKSSTEKAFDFTVQTFDLLLLCQDDFVVESSTLTFLLDHGFDFNAQYKYGLPYNRGNDKINISLNDATVRSLLNDIIKSQKPLILHNGLVDLIFIYQNLYSDLPLKLPTFLTDLSLMFPNTIYDTKYLADFEMRTEASYLEYIFRKCQRQNCIRSRQQKFFCQMSFLQYDDNQPVIMLACSLTSQPSLQDIGKTTVCQNFANHGWCINGGRCNESHDIDLILDTEENSKENNQTNLDNHSVEDDLTKKIETINQIEVGEKNNSSIKLYQSSPEYAMDHDGPNVKQIGESNSVSYNDNNLDGVCNDADTNAEKLPKTGPCIHELKSSINPSLKSLNSNSNSISSNIENRTNGHRAGLDAFMTGYIFATFLVRKKAFKDGVINEEFRDEYGNKVYLSGKDFPLQVVQSSYAKPSKNHLEKYGRIFSD